MTINAVGIDFNYSHAAILVANLERSAAFYEQTLGWERVALTEHDDALGRANRYGGSGRIMVGRIGGVRLHLVEMQVALARKELPMHYGIFMVSAVVPDLSPVREHLRAAGIAITRELAVGQSYLLVVTDPDGQEVGIVGPPQ